MSVSDKHMEAAEHTLDLVLCNGPEVPDYRAEAIKVIAAALAAAERKGMKRAAEIAQAEVKRLDRLQTEAEIIASVILSQAGEP